jgi:hypothetical protein
VNKQLLTIGIILSLGTIGCAGLGTQHASSLTAQIRGDQGLDALWMPARREPAQGIEMRYLGGEGLGSLWQRHEPRPSPVADPAYYERRSGGDLWNPASVTRSWEPKPSPSQARPSGGLIFSGTPSRMRAAQPRAAQ